MIRESILSVWREHQVDVAIIYRSGWAGDDAFITLV